MQEKWKPVVGYELKYGVSNLGRIKSLNYSNRGFEKLMVVCKRNKFWHWCIALHNWMQKNFIVSRLVAIAFIPNPLNLPCVLHKDETLDERWMLYNWEDNLFWGTKKDNSDDKWRKWRANNIFQTDNPRPTKWKFWKDNKCSKPVIQYTIVWEFIKEWYSASDVERELWLSQWNISTCCIWKAKTAYWFIWKFKIPS